MNVQSLRVQLKLSRICWKLIRKSTILAERTLKAYSSTNVAKIYEVLSTICIIMHSVWSLDYQYFVQQNFPHSTHTIMTNKFLISQYVREPNKLKTAILLSSCIEKSYSSQWNGQTCPKSRAICCISSPKLYKIHNVLHHLQAIFIFLMLFH